VGIVRPASVVPLPVSWRYPEGLPAGGIEAKESRPQFTPHAETALVALDVPKLVTLFLSASRRLEQILVFCTPCS
jgi:hypothetical protein